MLQRVVLVQPSNRPTVNLALSTLVVSALQTRPFLCKTKPIFTRSKSMQIFVTKGIIKTKHAFGYRKNKPNQTQWAKYNSPPIALFPLTFGWPRVYNGIFSRISRLHTTLSERVLK
jgi:hypothetical protein